MAAAWPRTRSAWSVPGPLSDPRPGPRAAFLDGNWDVFAGQMFTGLDHDRHVVEPFTLPASWQRYNGIDWGFAKPWAVLWAFPAPDWRPESAEARIDPNEVKRFGLLRMIFGDQIHFGGHEDLVGQIRILSVQGLAANNDELFFPSDFSRGAQHMVKLLLLHRFS